MNNNACLGSFALIISKVLPVISSWLTNRVTLNRAPTANVRSPIKLLPANVLRHVNAYQFSKVPNGIASIIGALPKRRVHYQRLPVIVALYDVVFSRNCHFKPLLGQRRQAFCPCQQAVCLNPFFLLCRAHLAQSFPVIFDFESRLKGSLPIIPKPFRHS